MPDRANLVLINFYCITILPVKVIVFVLKEKLFQA